MKQQLNANYHRQNGSTLLGLVIGLVLGLGIAVVVALMITQNPVPFVDKVGKQERSQVPGGKIEDPNRPMYGNRQAERPVVANTPESAPVSEFKPQANQGVATAPAAPAKADPADDKWIYYLQAGAFRAWNDAESERARLALMGFEAQITERQAENGTLYRVRMGPYAQADAMNKMRGRLSESGIEFAIIRAPK
jgi:cell division protein FtsN